MKWTILLNLNTNQQVYILIAKNTEEKKVNNNRNKNNREEKAEMSRSSSPPSLLYIQPQGLNAPDLHFQIIFPTKLQQAFAHKQKCNLVAYKLFTNLFKQ